MKKSPFADPEQPTEGTSQPGDVGFGYIGNDHDSAAGPKSPLKSAMKVPGTPARQLSNPLSPTFREEEMLEKREASTDKEQVKDIVSSCWESVFVCHQTSNIMATENQDSCSYGQVCSPRCQLQLFPDHLVHAVGLFCHLQLHKVSGCCQQVYAMGPQHSADSLATKTDSCHGMCLAIRLYPRLRRILPRRPQTSDQGQHVLHHVCNWLGEFPNLAHLNHANNYLKSFLLTVSISVHSKYASVGGHSRHLPAQQEQQQQ